MNTLKCTSRATLIGAVLVALPAAVAVAQEADESTSPTVVDARPDRGSGLPGADMAPAPALVFWLGSTTQMMSEEESDRSVEDRTLNALTLGGGVDVLSWLRVGAQFTRGASTGFGYPTDVDLRYTGADAVVRFAPLQLPYVTPYVKIAAGAVRGRLQLEPSTGFDATGGAWAARVSATAGVAVHYAFGAAELGAYFDGGYGFQTDWVFDSLEVENDQVDAGTLSVRGGNYGGGVFVRVPF